MKKNLSILILSCILSTVAFSQNKGGREVQHINVLKYNVLRNLAGEMLFSYERVVGEKSSLEVTGGLTIGNYANIFRFDNFGGAQVINGFGFKGELAYRYYVLDDRAALNSLYISPVIGYKIANETLIAPDFYANLSDVNQKHKERFYYKFNVGVQSWVSDNFSIDSYIGLGLGLQNEDNHRIFEEFDPNTGVVNARWINDPISRPVVICNFGIKMGIGWTGGY